jgi:hypothetical protein
MLGGEGSLPCLWPLVRLPRTGFLSFIQWWRLVDFPSIIWTVFVFNLTIKQKILARWSRLCHQCDWVTATNSSTWIYSGKYVEMYVGSNDVFLHGSLTHENKSFLFFIHIYKWRSSIIGKSPPGEKCQPQASGRGYEKGENKNMKTWKKRFKNER